MSQALATVKCVDNELRINLSGKWSIYSTRPKAADVFHALNQYSNLKKITFTYDKLDWDTSLLIYLVEIESFKHSHLIEVDISGLPDGVRRLVNLSRAVPPQQNKLQSAAQFGLVAAVGNFVLSLFMRAPDFLGFLGEAVLSANRFVRGKARFRRADLFLAIEQAGPQALPIVSLISFLVGVILAYMGALQLAQFGAQIYIADLVAIGMVREMAALMTGIIIAGRTGASFAAELGTMQVNDEIDALRVLGIAPMDFLVLPRLLALILMMPLLTLYASLVGLIAGMMITVAVFDIGVLEYYHETISALDLTQFAVGLFKGTVYGTLVALAGCYQGIRCGRSAQAVGQATTSAVVNSILYIVIAASVLTIVLQKLGI